MSALQLAMFSEVVPCLWELFCDLCIEEVPEVQGVVMHFYRKKKNQNLVY